MERLREKRYAEKMRHVKERVDDIEEWKNEFLQDEKTKLACYKATQEKIQSQGQASNCVLSLNGGIEVFGLDFRRENGNVVLQDL